MAVDKTIPELGAATSPLQLTDQSIVSRAGTDYNYTLQQLISFIQAGLIVGSLVTFGTSDPPANSFGANSDVYINPVSQKFYQRIAGSWVLQYTVNVTGVGNKTIFGNGVPNNATGNINDTYVNTATGVFYNKNNSNVWMQVFSMATGPAGAPGADGLDGANGTNGNTVLNGDTPPSNSGDGVNGDFYINTNTFIIYGPKTGGVWGAGTSIIGADGAIKTGYNYSNTDSRFTYNSITLDLLFTLNSDDQFLYPYGDNSILIATLREKITTNKYKSKNSFDPIITDDGVNYISVLFEGVDNDLINNAQILLS